MLFIMAAVPTGLSQKAMIETGRLPLEKRGLNTQEFRPNRLNYGQIGLLYNTKYIMNVALYARVSTKDRGQDIYLRGAASMKRFVYI